MLGESLEISSIVKQTTSNPVLAQLYLLEENTKEGDELIASIKLHAPLVPY